MFSAAGLTSSWLFRRIASGEHNPPRGQVTVHRAGHTVQFNPVICWPLALDRPAKRSHRPHPQDLLIHQRQRPQPSSLRFNRIQKSTYNTYPTWTSALLNPLSNQSWQYMSTFGIKILLHLISYLSTNLTGIGTTCYQGRLNSLLRRSKSVQILGRLHNYATGGENLNWAPTRPWALGGLATLTHGIINIMATTSGHDCDLNRLLEPSASAKLEQPMDDINQQRTLARWLSPLGSYAEQQLELRVEIQRRR